MRNILILLLILPSISYGLTFKDGKQVDVSESDSSSQTSTIMRCKLVKIQIKYLSL